MASKNWTPNENQKKFIEIVKGLSKPMTLAEINAEYGTDFKTGTINCLKDKGLYNTTKVKRVVMKPVKVDATLYYPDGVELAEGEEIVEE